MKRGGLIQITPEFLYYLLGIEDAEKKDYWIDKDTDLINIKYINAPEKYDVILNHDIPMGAYYPKVGPLDFNYFVNLWSDRISNIIKEDIND